MSHYLKIVGKFLNMNQPISHYLKIVGKFQNINQPMSHWSALFHKRDTTVVRA